MDNIYVLEDETKEIALDKRVADLYVAKIEIEGKAVSSIVGRGRGEGMDGGQSRGSPATGSGLVYVATARPVGELR